MEFDFPRKCGRILLLWWLCCLAAPRGSQAAQILVVPMDGSHWVNMKILLEALSLRGHRFTVLRPSMSWYILEDSLLYRSLTLDSNHLSQSFNNKDVMAEYLKRILAIRERGRSLSASLEMQEVTSEFVYNFQAYARGLITQAFENKTLLGLMEKAEFDLVLTDPAMALGVMLASHLKLPLVYNVRWTMNGEGHMDMAPSPPSYIPITGSGFTDRMSFLQRLQNILHYLLWGMISTYGSKPELNRLCQRYLGPGSDIDALLLSADLWLMRVDFVFEFPRPSLPNMVYVCGFQCKAAGALPEDLEEFVAGSGSHGVIVMSLGTLLGSLPSRVTEDLAEAFAHLPQRVVWRHTGPRPVQLGPNTLLMPWIPQNDLLGHPKTRAFVSHGGTNGVYEAIYHGVPVLGLPLMFDQFDNLLRLEARGVALVLDVVGMGPGEFARSLGLLLSDRAYADNMKRLSELHRDQPQPALDRAVFWVEYVARHKGAPHLRPAATASLGWAAYHSLDVACFLLTAALTLACLLLAGCGRVIRHCRARKAKAE